MKHRSNDQWQADLRSSDSSKEEALADLHAIILSGLPYALEKWIRPEDPRFMPFSEEVAQETLLRALAHLDEFEGRSQFTTWVHTIAVRVALSELRRSHWKEISLDELLEEQGDKPVQRDFPDQNSGTEISVEQRGLLALLDNIIQKELSDKQRRALIAAVDGLPMEQVAEQMQVERNALYKLVHDARLKIKKKLKEEGLSPTEILASFER